MYPGKGEYMAGILDSLTSMLSPEISGQLSKAVGVDPQTFNKGIGAVGPAILGSLTKTASTSEGASSLLGILPQDTGATGGTGGGFGDLINNVLTSVTGSTGGTQADLTQGILGPGANGITNTLSQKLGFNVQPIMGIALPLIMGLVGKVAHQGNLDASGLANELNSQTQAFAADPANKATTDLVNEALQAGDKSAALRQSFSDDEWMKVRLAPAEALYLVGTASQSGDTGQVKELAAAADAVMDSVQHAPPTSLIGTGFGGGLTSDEIDQLRKDAPPRDVILGNIHEATTIVSQKSPDDAEAYRTMVIDVAQKSAEAVKEGGFLGFGGTRVTAEEQQAINDIQSALA
jgi:hypothetical protein